ncbi:hypothetical protein DFH07DRAFT_7761 [Mycena maculata]|uniref:F-box domain-containing protein n=1 Tax=Mycena maculata TaxID=230809 RepID=A0AAD7P2W5_9AGAR|nr:hypothetical protein DFH07DRAFT_7761 [Mycena maculata]
MQGSNVPRPLSWSNLPVDILITIMGFATPHDILALRKVSKSLSHITHVRSVWIDALRRVCTQHDIYTPSFPSTEMTLDELERVATACRRFSSSLRHEFVSRQIVWPASIRYLHLSDSTHPEEHFRHVRLVPGGRFLLTSSGCTIRLWDIERSQENPNMLPIASFTIDDGVSDIQSIRVRASKSSAEVLVIVSSTELRSVYRVHVFTIFPPASSPEFIPFVPPLALGMEDEWPSIICSTSQHVAVSTGSSTVLWDFIADRWTSWPAEPNNANNTIYICNRNILTMRADHSEIHWAAFPTLHRRSLSAVPPQIQDLPILQIFKLRRFGQLEPLDDCLSGVSLVFHGRETSTFERPSHIDIFSDHGSRALFTHFALMPIVDANRTDNTVRCELVPLGESLLQAAYATAHSLRIEWAGHHDVQSFAVAEGVLHVCLSDTEKASSVSGILAIPGVDEVDEYHIDFCSFSGRVCARMATEDGVKVLVMDYLTPKPTQ